MKFSYVKENKKNIIFGSAVLAVTFLLSIFLIDFYFLNLGKKNWVCDICEFDAELGWRNIPSKKVSNEKVTYNTNSLGLRAEEIDPSKEHILILGDSVAFGAGVNDNETVSYFMQRETSKYQIINLAVPGYSIDQYYLNLEKYLAKLNPKHIIPIIFSGNDWIETLQNNMWGISKPFFKIENGKLTKQTSKLSMFSCWNYFHGSWFFSHFDHNSLAQSLCDRRVSSEEEGKKLVSIFLEKIKNLGDSVAAKTSMVLTPTLYDYYEETCSPGSMGQFCKSNQAFFSDFLRKRYLEFKKKHPEDDGSSFFLQAKFSGHKYNYLTLKEIIKEGKYPLVDLFKYFRNQSFNMGSIYNKDDPFHYSPLGHSVLAKVILQSLNSNSN